MEKSTKINPLCKYHCIFRKSTPISIYCKKLVRIPAVLREKRGGKKIAHVSYCPCTLLLMCQKKCQVVKKMSSCQKDVKLSKKMSNVKKSNTWTMEEIHKKLNWHNEVHPYWCQFWHHIWWSPKTLKMCIEHVFEQFWWPSYLMSKLTLICVNLIMSI